jgi:hypothetical protein
MAGIDTDGKIRQFKAGKSPFSWRLTPGSRSRDLPLWVCL